MDSVFFNYSENVDVQYDPMQYDTKRYDMIHFIVPLGKFVLDSQCCAHECRHTLYYIKQNSTICGSHNNKLRITYIRKTP